MKTILDGTGRRYVITRDRVTIYSPDSPTMSLRKDTAIRHARLPGHVQDEILRDLGRKPAPRRPIVR